MGNASQSAALSLFLLSETRKNKRVFVFEARKRHGTTTTHLDILILTHTSPTCRRDITEHRRQKHNDRQATQVIQCRHCKARTHGNHTTNVAQCHGGHPPSSHKREKGNARRKTPNTGLDVSRRVPGHNTTQTSPGYTTKS